MKKLLISLIGALALGATLPALAGPDWQAIEQARKAKQASQFARSGDAAERPAAGPATCPPERLVLPLDHGPRAQTTPYLNQQRKERYEARVKACQGTAK